jgi:hypothetical protein
MNRCQSILASRMSGLLLALLVATGSMSPPEAAAQLTVRQFPVAAKRGNMTVTAPPEVLINGKTEQLAPGARIHGLTNTLVMSGTLVGKTVIVNYTRENQGLIREVWILNQAEADLERSGMEPTINFNFDSAGNTPKTDDGKTPFNQLPKYPKQ